MPRLQAPTRTSSAATSPRGRPGRWRRSSVCARCRNTTWIRGNGERWLREPPLDRPEVLEELAAGRVGSRARTKAGCIRCRRSASSTGSSTCTARRCPTSRAFRRAGRRRRADVERRARYDRGLRPQPSAVHAARAERDDARQSGQRRHAARRRRRVRRTQCGMTTASSSSAASSTTSSVRRRRGSDSLAGDFGESAAKRIRRGSD